VIEKKFISMRCCRFPLIFLFISFTREGCVHQPDMVLEMILVAASKSAFAYVTNL